MLNLNNIMISDIYLIFNFITAPLYACMCHTINITHQSTLKFLKLEKSHIYSRNFRNNRYEQLVTKIHVEPTV
jgi:hypothetical protein